MTAKYHIKTFIKTCVTCESTFSTMIETIDKCSDCRFASKCEPSLFIKQVESSAKCDCCGVRIECVTETVDKNKAILCEKCYLMKTKMHTGTLTLGEICTEYKFEVEYQRSHIFCAQHQPEKSTTDAQRIRHFHGEDLVTISETAKMTHQTMTIKYDVPQCLKFSHYHHKILEGTVWKLVELEKKTLPCGCRIIYIIKDITMVSQN